MNSKNIRVVEKCSWIQEMFALLENVRESEKYLRLLKMLAYLKKVNNFWNPKHYLKFQTFFEDWTIF